MYVQSDEHLDGDIKVLRRVTSAGCAESALLAGSCERPRANHYPACFRAEDIARMMDELCERSPRRNTGECVHGCGVGRTGSLELVREDIGRHNAMDKLIGQAWLDGLPMRQMALFTTGRISYEMVLKAAQSTASVFVSRKSITDAAMELADQLGVTLVARCRENRMEVYTHHERIIS